MLARDKSHGYLVAVPPVAVQGRKRPSMMAFHRVPIARDEEAPDADSNTICHDAERVAAIDEG